MNTPRKTIATIVALLLFGATAPERITGTPSRAPDSCTAPQGALFNPCARLDTTQVQDRRAGPCEWVGGRWATVPCAYFNEDQGLDITIERQPTPESA